jgi:hypothetical protein
MRSEIRKVTTNQQPQDRTVLSTYADVPITTYLKGKRMEHTPEFHRDAPEAHRRIGYSRE